MDVVIFDYQTKEHYEENWLYHLMSGELAIRTNSQDERKQLCALTKSFNYVTEGDQSYVHFLDISKGYIVNYKFYAQTPNIPLLDFHNLNRYVYLRTMGVNNNDI